MADLPTANDDWQSDFGFEDTLSQASEEPAAAASAAPSRKRQRRKETAPAPPQPSRLGGSAAVSDGACRQEAAARRQQLLAMDAYSRHKMLVNSYIRYYGGSYADFDRDASGDKRDIDIIREHHKFVWDEADSSRGSGASWEQRLAKRYWDKLYKEYCIADLRGYREGRIGLRWRTEAEVLSGRGQFACGGKRCQEEDRLASWEVNFRYAEGGETKNALVKLRLCPDCSARLNYRKRHSEAKQRRMEGAAAQPTDQEAAAAAEAAPVDDDVLSGIRAIRDEQEQQREAAAAAATAAAASADANDVWRQPATVVEDEGASKEHEFDQYFADMLL